jgi:hypothetical protein
MPYGFPTRLGTPVPEDAMRLVRWVLAGVGSGLVAGVLWGLVRAQPVTDYSATYRAPDPADDLSAGYEARLPDRPAPATERSHAANTGV